MASESCGGNEELSGSGVPNREVVVETLRQEIVQGAIQPGERLTEWNIATRLGVSRGPVREGLRELEREGLIVSYPYRGAVVTDMTDTELLDLLLPVRLTIERFAAVAAFGQFTDKTISELDGVIVEMREAAAQQDIGRLYALDSAFHHGMIASGSHGHALQLWRSIHPRIQAQLHRIGRGVVRSPSQFADEHQLLLDLFRDRDEARLASALEQHILSSARSVLRRDADPTNWVADGAQ